MAGQLEFLLHENFITKKDGQDGVLYNIMPVFIIYLYTFRVRITPSALRASVP